MTEQLLGRVEAYLGLFLVNGGGVHLGGRLPVKQEHIKSYDRSECRLAVLAGDIDIGILIAPAFRGGAVPSEDVCRHEELPVLQLDPLAGEFTLEML